jgi:hypothetical protein
MVIDVNGGKYKMGKGKISDPNVTFVARDKDWVAVSNGKLGGTRAYLTGRLKYVAVRAPEKTGRNSPLELRLHGDSDVGSRIDSFLLIGPKKIELACDRDACARNDLERFETGISHLRTSAVLAVLNDGVV